MDDIKIVYINLDKRPDRRDHMINEFNSIGVKNFERFSAIEIKNDNLDKKSLGGIGCGLSHIKVLEKYSDCELLMIVEDDATFMVGKDYISQLIEKFKKSDGVVLCLGFDSYKDSFYNGLFKRTYHSLTTSCYIVKKSFFEELKNSFNNSIQNLMTNKNQYHLYAIDQTWTLLQKNNIFLIPNIHVVKQYSNYSDIVQKHVDRFC